jgi:hypothetical protein
MTSEELQEMFEGDVADTSARKFPIVSMGGRTEALACAEPGARTPIGASGIFLSSCFGGKTSFFQSFKAIKNRPPGGSALNNMQNLGTLQ